MPRGIKLANISKTMAVKPCRYENNVLDEEYKRKLTKKKKKKMHKER